MDYISLCFISILWGSSFLFIKITSDAIDPLGIATGRVLLAALVLTGWMWLRNAEWPRSRTLWKKLTLLSVVGQVFPFFMLGVAGHFTTSIDMALMMGAIPLIIFLLGRWIPPAEHWSGRTALGLAFGFLGVAVSLSDPVGATDLARWGGRAAAILAACGYAVGALLSRNISRDLDATTSVTSSMLVSALLLSVVWAFQHPTFSFSVLPSRALISLITLGVINTAVAYVVYFRLIHKAGATFAGMNNYLVPAVGIVAGSAVLGEPLQARVLLGLVLISGGVILVRTSRRT